MSFKEINMKDLHINPFTKIGDEWMLITAGTKEHFNTMTASWGNMGVIWGKSAVTAYIRPQRYTKEFVDSNDLFTLTFFPPEYKKSLSICGSKSGRDTDKITEAGLTPYFIDNTVAFEEASLIMVCKKMYHADMHPEAFDAPEEAVKWYPEKDYHTLYIAEVLKVFVNDQPER